MASVYQTRHGEYFGVINRTEDGYTEASVTGPLPYSQGVYTAAGHSTGSWAYTDTGQLGDEVSVKIDLLSALADIEVDALMGVPDA